MNEKQLEKHDHILHAIADMKQQLSRIEEDLDNAELSETMTDLYENLSEAKAKLNSAFADACRQCNAASNLRDEVSHGS